MIEPINFDKVADIYDYYVSVDFDIPFFLKESEGFNGEILELMCGTGRVSIPLLKAGRKLICIDYSNEMLACFRKKIAKKDYEQNASLLKMDVKKLNLNKKFGLIFIPFHSFSEIISEHGQIEALQSIANHLEYGGTFILTLQNPKKRLQQADGKIRFIGEFPLNKRSRIKISYMNLYDKKENIVSGFQWYEIYDSSNKIVEKRQLEINFKPISNNKMSDLLSVIKIQTTDIYGDYLYNTFDEETSDFIIYKMRKI